MQTFVLYLLMISVKVNTYRVQSYWACFGLYPSSCMWKTKDHVSETGSVSVLRWMGQDKPTQLGPLERASLSHWIETSWYVEDNRPQRFGDCICLRPQVDGAG
jgi:hypothetical protein